MTDGVGSIGALPVSVEQFINEDERNSNLLHLPVLALSGNLLSFILSQTRCLGLRPGRCFSGWLVQAIIAKQRFVCYGAQDAIIYVP